VASYRVLTGLQYKGKEAVAGDVIDDVPATDISWLVEQGHIELIEQPAPKKTSRKKVVADAEETD